MPPKRKAPPPNPPLPQVKRAKKHNVTTASAGGRQRLGRPGHHDSEPSSDRDGPLFSLHSPEQNEGGEDDGDEERNPYLPPPPATVALPTPLSLPSPLQQEQEEEGGGSGEDGSEEDGEDEGEEDGEDEEDQEDGEGEEDGEEEEEWEDVLAPGTTSSSGAAATATGNLELALNPPLPSTTPPPRKGATAADRRTRLLTHCLHVQCLLAHGHIRNRWLDHPLVRAVMLSLVPPGIMRHLERLPPAPAPAATATAIATTATTKGKGNGDPLLGPLGSLLHWWRGRFTVSAPGLRKCGYQSLQHMQQLQQLQQGETIQGPEGLARCASTCSGSRDVGALLFTALCRAFGWHARLVFSLQPLGFGFSAAEMAGNPCDPGGPSDAPVKDASGSGSDREAGCSEPNNSALFPFPRPPHHAPCAASDSQPQSTAT